jgi:hypothetical protein
MPAMLLRNHPWIREVAYKMFNLIFGKKENGNKDLMSGKSSQRIKEIEYKKENKKITKVSDDVLAKAIKDMLKK